MTKYYGEISRQCKKKEKKNRKRGEKPKTKVKTEGCKKQLFLKSHRTLPLSLSNIQIVIKNDSGEECGCWMTVELSVSELMMLSIVLELSLNKLLQSSKD